MTDYCTIGPVSIEYAHLFDESEWTFSNNATETITSGAKIVSRGQYGEKYSMAILCSFDEALQLKGVVEQGDVIWMNTSDLTDNDYLQHKGWVILTGLSITEENPWDTCQCKIEYVKVSDYENEYLTMDYSKGVYDGINIEPTYDIVSTSYIINENGSDATTNWYDASRDYKASSTWSTTGTVLSLAAQADTDGTQGYAWNRYDTATFDTPFTVEITLDYSAYASSSNSFQIGFGISDKIYPDAKSPIQTKSYNNWMEFRWSIGSASTSFQIRTKKNNKWISEVAPTSLACAAGTKLKVKMEFSTAGKVRVLTDTGVTGTYTQRYYGPSNLTSLDDLSFYVFNDNKDSTSRSAYFDDIKVYTENEQTFPNIVMIPPSASNITPTATGSRTVEDGTASYYANPTYEIRYQIAKTDYYKGSVKLYSTNNDNTASRQVLSTGVKLTPATTTLKNGMTQLTFDADEVILSAYYGAAYNEINRFHYTDDIDYIKPIFISNERVVLQINDTKWTMLRSSPVVTVEHPNTTLGYTLKDRYVHDGVTTSSPAADADITMEDVNSGYYAGIYNNGDTYELIVVKRDPTTIKSDSLPGDNITGIGWALIAGTTYDTPASRAQQWYRQTRTGISLKQII